MRDAKFRGKPFFVEEHELSGGRRKQVTEYPLRDDPATEDLGRKAHRFSFQAFVIGPDYMAARDALLEALDEAGPGELIHPYFGSRTVDILEWSVRESTRKGGMATFTISCVQAGKTVLPSRTVNTAVGVQTASASLTEVTAAGFVETWDVSGPEWVRLEALDAVDSALDAISGAMDMTSMPFDMANSALADITSLKADGLSLLNFPDLLADRLCALVDDLFDLVSFDTSGLSLFSSLFSFSSSTRAASSPLSTVGAKVAANGSALTRLIRNTALASAATAFASTTAASTASTSTGSSTGFETFDDALAVREELVQAIDASSSEASDPEYAALTDLRVAVVQDFASRESLPRLTSYQPAETLPAVVVAYDIYGDAAQADQIVTRNKVRHPGAIPGGSVLEVLGG
ncbi:hypothetical protein AWY79_00290 [Pseudodesulfovibrio indicus]|uniref:DNA circulation N-terminal domain-containing protein n=1 Tax=Pseudodesulfovibrio indicus TaxID=1716143 RepID=A0ABM5YQR3_9BACT|nr:hypothetical protein AWY79_00290 [Pseudodesulfovibrio indicus]